MNVDKISPEFATALLEAQKAMSPVKKKKENPAFRGSKYATLADCQEAVTEPLNDNDIVYRCPLVSREGMVGAVPTMIYGPTGEILEDEGFYLSVSKNDPQGHGSAGTYVQRYATLAAFALPTEDDDGNKATFNKPPQQATVRPPVAQTTKPTNPAPTAQTAQVKPPIDPNSPVTQAQVDGYVKKWHEVNDGKGLVLGDNSAFLGMKYGELAALYKELK